MSEIGNKIVTGFIKNYYKTTGGIAPDRIEQREFGFGTFENRISLRHTSFGSEKDLRDYLVGTAPLHVDYSAAYYRHPEASPMERKEWLGSELRFDIDSNDIPTPCKLDHGREWICESCLDAAKEEVIKLMDNFLIADFGLSEKEIEMNFSGNRGYHLHIKKESVLSLDANAREELSNYIFGQEPNLDSFFYTTDLGHNRKKQFGPKPSDGGWRGKVARAFMDATSSKEDLTTLGIDKATASWIFKNMTVVKEQISQGNWDFHPIPKRQEVFANLLHNQAIKQGNRIDRGVTRDPSHLMRLPNAIHGGTGLVARKIASRTMLEKFDPMKEAIAFRNGELRVNANTKYKLFMNEQEFGPFKNATVRLPTYAATYLYLKGLADIVTSS